jgi:hypothetical protein
MFIFRTLGLVCAATLAVAACTSEASSPTSVRDAGTTADANNGGSSDGGTAVTDAGACRPADVSIFQPSYKPASGAGQGACIPQHVDAYLDGCLRQTSTEKTCTDAKAIVDKACQTCLITPATAERYGPVLAHGGYITLNLAGCLELTGGPAGLRCAKDLQASEACQKSACDQNCPVKDRDTLGSWEACAEAAAAGGCKTFHERIGCIGDFADAGPASYCIAPTFEESFRRFALLFCAGKDAGG